MAKWKYAGKIRNAMRVRENQKLAMPRASTPDDLITATSSWELSVSISSSTMYILAHVTIRGFPWAHYCYFSHLTHVKIEIQRGQVTCTCFKAIAYWSQDSNPSLTASEPPGPFCTLEFPLCESSLDESFLRSPRRESTQHLCTWWPFNFTQKMREICNTINLGCSSRTIFFFPLGEHVVLCTEQEWISKDQSLTVFEVAFWNERTLKK